MVRKVIVCLGVAAALLVGCGSDDSSISKQEYDQKLELVCNEGLQAREELINDLGEELQQQRKKPSTDSQTEAVRKLIAAYQTTTEEIADIGLPEENEQKAEELVEAREEAAAKVEADPLGSVGITATTFERANKLAEDFEAKACAT